MRMSLEMIFRAGSTVEHDDLLRISALRHNVSLSGIGDLIVWAVWTCDAEASASSDASTSCYCRSEDVRILAVIVAKLKLSQIQRQIFLADMMKTSHHTALEQAPERFEIVCMDLTAYILASAMA